jgi:hypothetical protein
MLDPEDQALFTRFRYRTLYTLGGPAMVDIYESHMLDVSFTVSPRNESPAPLSAANYEKSQDP